MGWNTEDRCKTKVIGEKRPPAMAGKPATAGKPFAKIAKGKPPGIFS
jgi:hypothetical protein